MINSERLLKSFVELASLYSPSYRERAAADYVTQRLRAMGLKPEEDRAGETFGGNAGNLYLYIKGIRECDPRLFCAHLDTVEPCREKKISVTGDIIHTDGSTILGADNCAAAAAILEAAAVLKENNIDHGPIELLFTVGEEVYSKGAGALDYSKIQAKTAFIPDYDGPMGQAVVKAPTILSFTAHVKGKASHAGFAPQQGISAICAAAKAIDSLRLGRVDEETTVNVGLISGGNATNIVPDSCVVKGEIRSYSHQKAMAQLKEIEEKFKAQGSCDFSHEICIYAYETKTDSPACSLYSRACLQLGLKPDFVSSFGGSDNNSFAKNGIQGIVPASAMHRCHSGEEFTTKQELFQLALLIIQLMSLED